jgi:hypothetical protein
LKTYCFDLDGVICKEDSDDYAKRTPRNNVITKMTELKNTGNKIVIYTGRHILNKDITKTWLERWAVPYDLIQYGKPVADVYIDNLGKNSYDWEQRKSNTVCIICAKETSRRFPNKNKVLIDDVMTQVSMSEHIDKVVLATDMEELGRYQSNKVSVVMRPKNACNPEDSVFDVVRWAYLSLDESYHYVHVVLPNQIGFNHNAMSRSLNTLIKNDLQEVRSYDKSGVENGLITMTKDRLLSRNISTYCGAIVTEAKEVHKEGDLNECN